EYGFYAIAVLLTYFLIIRPVNIIMFSPSFSVETTLDKASRKNFLVYKKVAKRLIALDTFPPEEEKKLLAAMGSSILLREALNDTFNKYIKKEMNQVIRRNAKTVMISTAISQNGRLDFFTIVAVNLKMIKELVVMCGFRPSFKNLSKLTLNVFTTALIAEGLENMDITEVLPTSTVNAIGDIPFIKPLVSSVAQGMGNALLTLRIGIVTRKYLFSDAKEITKEEIRRTALLEAAAMMPQVMADGFMMLPKRIAALFKKPQSKSNVDNLDEQGA
ncbi:MAG: DUF697 domain-containing protein, partial [Acholeplasmataceae bacterium]|nr:DUF697 domain-containing protein [Acholeplasmataceae bacterium]